MSKKSPTMFPAETAADSHLSGCFFDFYKPRADDLERYDWGPSLTRQEFAEDCDINTIMKRYETTGVLPQTSVQPHYADYTNVPDLMQAMDVLRVATDNFMSLPARVRREFDNDPVEFVAFASDPANLDQMRSWGLAPPAPEPAVGAGQVIPVGSPAGKAGEPEKPAGEASKPA